jgi:hypothetical protein
VVTYQYTPEAANAMGLDSTKVVIGQIAQEYNAVYVPRTPMMNKITINGVEGDYYGLDTNKMLNELPAAHKHAMSRIEALEARLYALENP